MQKWEASLDRWVQAGLVDKATADRIYAYEVAQGRPEGARWQVILALTFGAILLAAGVLLFTAAHWDEFSPAGRLALVLGLLGAMHIGAVATTDRFPFMATALHAVGTVGAGAAIATVGQIFHMQEHWPASVLLWALCALAGWWWLRDQLQLVCLLLLAPAWLVCEWSFRADPYQGNVIYCARMLAVLAAVYLTSFLHSKMRAAWGILFGIAAVGFTIVTVMLSEGWSDNWSNKPMLPYRLRVGAIAVMVLIGLAGFLYEKRSLLPIVVVAAASFALPWLRVKLGHDPLPGQRCIENCDYVHWEPSVFLYALVAAVALFFCWWGLRECSKPLVNYGIVCFFLTVVWFYFSSLMDKLGRSLGLIGLGVVFLAGGWLLERFRRSLMLQMESAPAMPEVAP